MKFLVFSSELSSDDRTAPPNPPGGGMPGMGMPQQGGIDMSGFGQPGMGVPNGGMPNGMPSMPNGMLGMMPPGGMPSM